MADDVTIVYCALKRGARTKLKTVGSVNSSRHSSGSWNPAFKRENIQHQGVSNGKLDPSFRWGDRKGVEYLSA
jgi:hypothetical protein